MARRKEDEEITAVLKQFTLAASRCEETRRPHGDVSVARSGGVLWVSRAAIRSPRRDRRVSALYATRFPFGTWSQSPKERTEGRRKVHVSRGPQG